MSENEDNIEVKIYDESEVAEHNTEESNWIIIRNYVYDVTKFACEHPGGQDILLDNAGQDATYEFIDTGHSADAKELMKKYRIGKVVKTWDKPEVQVVSDTNWMSTVIAIVVALIASFLYLYFFG